eukprot:838123-Prymnesium_polylepis.1
MADRDRNTQYAQSGPTAPTVARAIANRQFHQQLLSHHRPRCLPPSRAAVPSPPTAIPLLLSCIVRTVAAGNP